MSETISSAQLQGTGHDSAVQGQAFASGWAWLPSSGFITLWWLKCPRLVPRELPPSVHNYREIRLDMTRGIWKTSGLSETRWGMPCSCLDRTCHLNPALSSTHSNWSYTPGAHTGKKINTSRGVAVAQKMHENIPLTCTKPTLRHTTKLVQIFNERQTT